MNFSRPLLAVFLFLVLLAGAEAKSVHTLTLSTGKKIRVALSEYVNDRGQREMLIESYDLASVVLGYGRDLNRNGVIETFFLSGANGIHSYQREAAGESSALRALKIVAHHGRYSGKDYYWKITTNVFGALMMSMDAANRAQKEYFQDWMDLEELNLAYRSRSSLLTRSERIFIINLQLKGHEFALQKLQDSLKRANRIWIADAGLWLGGGILVKGALRMIGGKRAVAGISAAVGGRIAIGTYPALVRTALRGLTARSILAGSRNIAVKGLQGIRKEWRYIALSTGTQLGVESYINFNDVKDPNPGIVAQNLMANRSVRENVSISVIDSLGVAAAVNNVKTLRARFAVLGMIGVGSSAAVGAGMDGRQSTFRMAFDAGWSVAVDSASTLMELRVLHHFQNQAVKTRNPKLRIVGYAIVFVSQVGGYWGYSKAAKYIEANDLNQGKVMMVPVVASTR